MKNFFVALIAVSIIAAGGFLLLPKGEQKSSGNSGPFHTEQETFAAGLIDGGGIRATSTSGATVALLASDFDQEKVIDVMLNVQSATLSFPASTTLKSFLPNPGDTRSILVRNATTTAATTLTITGGTGVLMKFASTTPANNGIITGDTDGANYARILLVRKANKDFEALVDMFKD